MAKNANEMSLWERLTSPTPPFFKKLSNIGIILSAIGGALTQAEIINVSPDVATWGYYILTAGAVLASISRAAVDMPDYKADDEETAA